MDDFNLIEMGENYNTLRGVNLEPFKDPKQHKSKLLQELHYYSQLTMEFYIIATGAPKDMKLCLPYIKANMEQSLLRKRFAELKLITYELDDLVLGIDCSNKEQVYQAHHILPSTSFSKSSNSHLRKYLNVIPHDQNTENSLMTISVVWLLSLKTKPSKTLSPKNSFHISV